MTGRGIIVDQYDEITCTRGQDMLITGMREVQSQSEPKFGIYLSRRHKATLNCVLLCAFMVVAMNEIWDNPKLQGQWNIHRMAINAIQFSPDKRYLASSDKEGLLVVRETATKKCIRLYKAKVSITCVRWDPSKPSLIFVGLSNGEVNKVKISPKGPEYDDQELETVGGWIHDLCIDDTGTQVFVAQGNRVMTSYRDSLEKAWGPLMSLSIPRIEDGIHPLVRQLHWSKDLLIVCFFFQGLGAMSTTPFSEQWRLRTRKKAFIGGSALSPSGKRLVIFNMFDGLDWYGTSNQKLLSTTRFIIGAHRFVDVVLVDEETTIVGHTLGAVLIATFDGVDSQVVQNITCLATLDPIQTLACATINGNLMIAGGSTPIANPTATVVLITEDRRDFDNKTRRSNLRKCAYCLIQSVIILTTLATILVIVFPPLKPEPTIPTMNPVVVTKTKTETESAIATRVILKTKLETTTVTQTEAITLTVTRQDMQEVPKTATVTQTDAVILMVTETHAMSNVLGTAAVEAITQTVTELQAFIITQTEAAKMITSTTTETLTVPQTLPPDVAAPSGWENTTTHFYQFCFIAFCAVVIVVGRGVNNPGAVPGGVDTRSSPHSCSAQEELEHIRGKMVMADAQEHHPNEVREDHATEVRRGQPGKAWGNQVQEGHSTQVRGDQPAEALDKVLDFARVQGEPAEAGDRSNVHESHPPELQEGLITECEGTQEDMDDGPVEVQARPTLHEETKDEEAQSGRKIRVDQGESRAEAAEGGSGHSGNIPASIEPEDETTTFPQEMPNDTGTPDAPVDIGAEEGPGVAEGRSESASEGAIPPDESTKGTRTLAGGESNVDRNEKVVDCKEAEVEIEVESGEQVKEGGSDDDNDAEKTVTGRRGKKGSGTTVGENKQLRQAERLMGTQVAPVTNTKAANATKPTKAATVPKLAKKPSRSRAADPTSTGKGQGWK